MNELLKALQERLNSVIILGVRSISQDFKLKEIYIKLEQFKSKAPVLQKLYDLLTSIMENGNIDDFSEILILIEAILRTQAITTTEGEKKKIEIVDIEHKKFSLSQEELENIVTEGKKNIPPLVYQNEKRTDIRLLSYFINKDLECLYRYGKGIDNIVFNMYDKSNNRQKCEIISVLSKVDAKKYNDFIFEKFKEEKSTRTRERILDFLTINEDDKRLLFNLAIKHKNDDTKNYEYKSLNLQIYAWLLCNDNIEMFEDIKESISSGSKKGLCFVSDIIDYTSKLKLEVALKLIDILAGNNNIFKKNSKTANHSELNFKITGNILNSIEYLEEDKEILKKNNMDKIIHTINIIKRKYPNLIEDINFGKLFQFVKKSKDEELIIKFIEVSDKEEDYTEQFVMIVTLFSEYYNEKKIYDLFSDKLQYGQGTAKRYCFASFIEGVMREYCYFNKNIFGDIGYTTLGIPKELFMEILKIIEQMRWDKRWITTAKNNNMIYLETFVRIKIYEECKKNNPNYTDDYYVQIYDEVTFDEVILYSKDKSEKRKKLEQKYNELCLLALGLCKTSNYKFINENLIVKILEIEENIKYTINASVFLSNCLSNAIKDDIVNSKEFFENIIKIEKEFTNKKVENNFKEFLKMLLFYVKMDS